MALERKYGITVYDSSYVGFAQIAGCPLITSDRKLCQKIKELLGILCISDYDSDKW